MRAIGLVVKHEIVTTLKKRSFWILTFLMPVLLLAFNAYYVIRDDELGNGDDGVETNAAQEVGLTPATPVIGLVDEAGLISETPADIPPDMFVRYPDEATARTALEVGEIEQYVLIPADYLDTGEVTAYDQNFQILRGGQSMGVASDRANKGMLTQLINHNLTGDEQLARALRDPVPRVLAERHVVNPPVGGDPSDQVLAKTVASFIPYTYYFILIVVSGYILQSVSAEKENRTVEVLLLSLHSRELMVGKILGLSAVALVQLAVWLGGGMLILNQGAELLNVSDFTFPPGFLAWAILFLALGYLLYASVMAAAGAIAPNAREGKQVTWLLILPLLPTLMFGRLFLEEPHGAISMALSLFPFSAPSAMVTRLAVAQVPAWQLVVSLLGLAGTTYLLVTLAARFFSANNLLSHAPFNWRRMTTGWRQSAS
jgi:ABC-2 type transport system permease protein